MKGKEIKLVTFVEESKGVAALILEKARWVGEGGTNAVVQWGALPVFSNKACLQQVWEPLI